MDYAKLIDGKLILAPNPILVGANYIGNPPGSMYEAEGYKPLVRADDPGEAPEGFVWAETWTDEGDRILQGWEPVEETDVSAEEAIEYLFGGES